MVSKVPHSIYMESTLTLLTPARLAREGRAPLGLRPSLRFDTFERLPLPRILFASSSLRFLSRPEYPCQPIRETGAEKLVNLRF